MADKRRRIQAGLAALVAFSLVVCPLGWAGAIAGYPASAAGQAQIDFTPDVPTAFASPIPMPTPIPTVGPGQIYERDDPLRPAVTVIAGDSRFGYGYLSNQPELLVVWITNESGTWYQVVEEGSPLVAGEGDLHGFTWYITERDRILRDIATAYDDMTTYNDTADDFFLGAMALGVGGAVCLAFTVGLCGFLLGGAIAGGWLMETNQSNAELEQNDIEGLRADLFEMEAEMEALFGRYAAMAPTP